VSAGGRLRSRLGWGGLAAAGWLLLSAAAQQPCPSLSQLAARHRWYWGSSVDRQWLDDADTVQLVRTHARVVVPENALKWEVVNPSPGVRRLDDFAAIEARFAPSGMRFRGHPLVWHEQLPHWVTTAPADTLAQHLRDHIVWLVGTYRGRIHSWDVVNEPLAADGRGLRPTLWLQALGPTYIADALRWARAADPDAQLVINEYGLEGDDPVSLRKRRSLLHLVRDLRRQGVPLDAIGLQAHLRASAGGPTFGTLPAFLAELRRFDLGIVITELDVNDHDLPGSAAERDRRTADLYRDFLTVLLAEPAVEGVVQWGLTDRYSWLTQWEPRRDGTPQRPLPFDHHLMPKPAFGAICRALGGGSADSGIRCGKGMVRRGQDRKDCSKELLLNSD
jgi:endo-1,4-beta-xylanase